MADPLPDPKMEAMKRRLKKLTDVKVGGTPTEEDDQPDQSAPVSGAY